MSQQIFDRYGRCYTFSIVENDALLRLQLHSQDMLVGEMKCVRQSATSLWIGDIAIANEASPLVTSLWQQLLQKLPGYRPKRINYRGRGLGSVLMAALINYAREHSIQVLQGEVFRQDIENTPQLLEWYQKQGFELREPGPADKEDVVAMLYQAIEPNSERMQPSA